MNSLRQIIKEHLLLEKRIAQLSDSFKVTFGFDIISSKHSRDRSNLGRPGLGDRVISNQEIIDVIEKSKRKISEYIVNGVIEDGEAFIIKDKGSRIDMVVLPTYIEDFYWDLLVKTVISSSEHIQLMTGKDQLVIRA